MRKTRSKTRRLEPLEDRRLLTTVDFNFDGYVDSRDIDLLSDAVQRGDLDAEFDLNDDGAVSSDDIDVWLGSAANANGFSSGYLSGDLNLDGRVNTFDLNILAQNWLRKDATWSTGNLDGRGTVDASDLNALSLNWLQETPRKVVSAAQFEKRPSVGTSPNSATSGDLNNDGIPDLVITNSVSDDVSVLLGIGDGTFLPEQRVAAGNYPISVTIADLNADGIADLAVANWHSHDVSVLVGAVDGSYSESQRLRVGQYPTSLHAGDFDQDGVIDLAVVSSDWHFVSVLLGTDSGLFDSEQIRTQVGTSSWASEMGDYNRDGVLDLVVENFRGFAVLTGNGDGTFARQDFGDIGPGAEERARVRSAEWNDDEYVDLLLLRGDELSIFLGSSDGTFQLEQTHELKWLHDFVVGDFNGDGHHDLASHVASWVVLYSGLEDGSFSDAELVAVADRDGGISVGDFDGNGIDDIVTPNRDADDVSVLLGNDDGPLAGESSHYFAGASPVDMELGDLNQDGILDLIALGRGFPSWGAGAISVLPGNSSGGFEDQSIILPKELDIQYAVGDRPAEMAIGDLNSDGFLDIVTANERSDDLSVLFGNGDTTFGTEARIALEGAPQSVAIADLNQDDILDIATVTEGSVSVVFGSQGGAFSAVSSIAAVDEPVFVRSHDFNEDGFSDLVVTDASTNEVLLLLGIGNGQFSPPARYPVGESPTSFALGDLNGDGDVDLAVTNHASADISVLLANGDGTFGIHRRYAVGEEPFAAAIGDVNGDGSADLAFTTKSDVSILLGYGDGVFASEQRETIGGSPSFEILVQDRNGDGLDDLVIGLKSYVAIVFAESPISESRNNKSPLAESDSLQRRAWSEVMRRR